MGGKYGFLPLVLTETKMRLATGNQNPDRKRIENPKLLKPKIEDNIKVHELLQFQEDHKVNWKEYNFQEVVDSVEVETIVTAVYAQ